METVWKIIVAGMLITIVIVVVASAYRNLSPSNWFSLKMATSTAVDLNKQYYAPASGGTKSSKSFKPSGASSSSQSSQNYDQPVNPKEVPEGFTLADLSPYFKKVRISSVSPAYFGSYEKISLYAYLKEGERVNVSGWQLKGNHGSQIVPKAVNFYEPSGLSAEEDIYLENGHRLYMYSTVSPVGRNLRMNKCIGYLESYLDFKPPLPQFCPAIDRSEIAGFTGRCQDLILSIGSCRLPPENPLIPWNDYACRSFLDTLNYGGCVSRYRKDSDFLGKEWRVWYGASTFLDSRHDRLLLLDQNGKLVDIRIY